MPEYKFHSLTRSGESNKQAVVMHPFTADFGPTSVCESAVQQPKIAKFVLYATPWLTKHVRGGPLRLGPGLG